MPSVYILKFPKFPETFPLYPSLRGARARRTWDVLREIYCTVYKKITYHFSILKVFRKDSTTQNLVIFFIVTTLQLILGTKQSKSKDDRQEIVKLIHQEWSLSRHLKTC